MLFHPTHQIEKTVLMNTDFSLFLQQPMFHLLYSLGNFMFYTLQLFLLGCFRIYHSI